MEAIEKYFDGLSAEQLGRLEELGRVFREWNARINLVSRKDIESFEEHHLLHSLALAKVNGWYRPGVRVLDVGTGGGLPGLPLAILYPEAKFFLCDSVGKKIRAVADMARELGLDNVQAVHKRAEELESKWDFVIGRAVTALPRFLGWISKNIRAGGDRDFPNGVLYLKGDLYRDELESIGIKPYAVHDIHTLFPEPYFENKYIIHLTAKSVAHCKPVEE